MKKLQRFGNLLGFLFVFLSGECLIIASHLMDKESGAKVAEEIKRKILE